MTKKNIFLFATAIGFAVFTSCVPARKFDELEAKEKACQSELTAIKVSNRQLEEKRKGRNERLEKDIKE